MSTEAILADARARLVDAPQEAIGELIEPRRVLGVGRSPRILARGTAWHLGVLLLTDDGLLATGEIVRAREPARRGYTAESQRRRAELAEAARRGGFAEGRTVHVGWQRIDLDAVQGGAASGPVVLDEGVPRVRWSARGGFMPLERYLAERIDLLLEPPAGA